MSKTEDALPPLGEEIEHAIGATSPHLLALAKRYAANTVHSYLFAVEAEAIVRRAVRAALAQRQQVPEGWRDALMAASIALRQLSERAKQVKAALDADLPDGSPVHPQSSALTWPISTALLAIDKIDAALTAAPPAQQQSQPPRSIIITLRQARELVELFGGADSEVVVTKREAGEIQPDRREDRGLCPEDGLSSHAQGTGSRSSDRP